MRDLKLFVSSCGLSIFLSFGFSWLACRFGLLFDGLDFIFAVIFATGTCAMGTMIFLTFKPRRYLGRWLFGETLFLSLIVVCLWSWLSTNEHMNHFVGPQSKEVHVINGRSIMFSSYVHFSGPPEVIAAIIHSKGLVEVPAEMPEELPKGNDGQGHLERLQNKDSHGWWRPATMSGPRFFFLGHPGLGLNSGYWSEDWWVNGATNEVYALISG
jgi:hypothetical protein